MRAWLKEHESPVYGTKQQMFARIVDRYKQVLKDELIDKELARRLEQAREGQPLMPAVALPAPKQPTKAEREEHEMTHAKFMPWCEFCIMGKGAAAAHRAVDPNEREKMGPRIEFDFAHMKADGTFAEECAEFEYSDVYCTHLVGVDMGNGKLFCTAMDLKGGAETDQSKYNVESVVSGCDTATAEAVYTHLKRAHIRCNKVWGNHTLMICASM